MDIICIFRMVRKLVAVGFLPIIVVRPAFARLEADPIVVQHPALADLLDYYKKTWLDGDFPMCMWNVHADETRTNNAIEGWHHRLNGRIARAHPNTHQLVATIKEEQAATDMTIRHADQGMAPPRRRRVYRELQARLDRLLDQYQQGGLTTDQYLDSLHHSLHEF